jgi:hypothetical protein
MEFENKCEILADLWLNFKDDENLEDFVEYNDLGLPLAYLIHTEIVIPTELSYTYVEETYNLLAESLGLDLDQDFYTLQEMYNASPHGEE